jgi:hypothetical protein
MSWNDDETEAYALPPAGGVRRAFNVVAGTVVGWCWIHLLIVVGSFIDFREAGSMDRKPRRGLSA